MTWISHDPPLVFIHNPRTGGTSFIETLKTKCPLTSYTSQEWQAKLKPYYVKDHSVDIPEMCREYPVVAACRNPYLRELSYYLWNRRHPTSNLPCHIAAAAMDFTRYMEFRLWYDDYDPFHKRMFANQSGFLAGVPCTTMLRFERLGEDFASMTDSLLGVQLPLVLSNDTASGRYDPAEMYSLKAVRLVREYAAEDFERFNYDPEDIP